VRSQKASKFSNICLHHRTVAFTLVATQQTCNQLLTRFSVVVLMSVATRRCRDALATSRNCRKDVSRNATYLRPIGHELFIGCTCVSRDATIQPHCVIAAHSSVATQRICNGVATRCLIVANMSVATRPCSNIA